MHVIVKYGPAQSDYMGIGLSLINVDFIAAPFLSVIQLALFCPDPEMHGVAETGPNGLLR